MITFIRGMINMVNLKTFSKKHDQVSQNPSTRNCQPENGLLVLSYSITYMSGKTILAIITHDISWRKTQGELSLAPCGKKKKQRCTSVIFQIIGPLIDQQIIKVKQPDR